MRFEHHGEQASLKVLGAEIGCIDIIRHNSFEKIEVLSIRRQDLRRESLLKNPHFCLGNFVADAYAAFERRVGQGLAMSKLAAGDFWKVAVEGRPLRASQMKLDVEEPYIDIFRILGQYSLQRDPALRALYPKLAQHVRVTGSSIDQDTIGDALMEIVTKGAMKGSLFTTDTGYVGLSRDNIQAGDVVCVLFGCRMPAILRPLGDGSYRLVTFAYVDDVVNKFDNLTEVTEFHNVTEVTGDFIKAIRPESEKEFLLR